MKMNQSTPKSVEDAILELRRQPYQESMIRDAYLLADVSDEAKRFADSAEFAAVISLIGGVIGKRVVDLGAGTGIASWAFATRGAEAVYAVEPDPSAHVGRGAIEKLIAQLPIAPVDATGEALPFPDRHADIVYTRQVLHHISDLDAVLAECSRILSPGGILLATREHVVRNEQELTVFLQNHPVHALVGGENAHSLQVYVEAISSAGLRIDRVIRPWESVINAYPTVGSDPELREYPRLALQRKYGRLGSVVGSFPPIGALIRKLLFGRVPGRMYSFIATKP